VQTNAQSGMYHSIFHISLEAIFWVACIILSLAIIGGECVTHSASGYVVQVCERGLSLVDIALIVFLAPLVFIYLAVTGLNITFKFW